MCHAVPRDERGHCGRRGDTLYAEVDEETAHRQALPMMQPPLGGYSTSAVQTSGSQTAEQPQTSAWSSSGSTPSPRLPKRLAAVCTTTAGHWMSSLPRS